MKGAIKIEIILYMNVLITALDNQNKMHKVSFSL